MNIDFLNSIVQGGDTRTEYDPATGRVLAQIDPSGQRTTFDYYPADHAAAGRLRSTTNPAGKIQQVAYNLRGQQTAAWGQALRPPRKIAPFRVIYP